MGASRVGRRLGILVGFAWALAAASCRDAGGTAKLPPDLVLISIDSLRPDRLGFEGYDRPTSPTLDRIAREGVVFDRAWSNSSWTLPSHATMLTGLYDRVHRVRDVDQVLNPARRTLAEVLQDAGYHTAAIVSGPPLNPVYGFGQGFESYVDVTPYHPVLTGDQRRQVDRLRAQAGGDVGKLHQLREALQAAAAETNPDIAAAVTAPDAFSRAFATLAKVPSPLFLFLHLYDVHYDFRPPAEVTARFDPNWRGQFDFTHMASNPAIRPGMPPGALRHLNALYDGEIVLLDGWLDRFVKRLDERRPPEETVLLVTADHGDEFFEHGRFLHSKTLYEEVLRIPMVLRARGRVPMGRRVRAAARLVDVMPTLLDLAGIPPPPEAQGRSLLPACRGEETGAVPVVAELDHMGRRLASMTLGTDKVILDIETSKATYFDLAADPDEAAPIPAGDDPRGREMRSRLEAWLRKADDLAAHLPWNPEDPAVIETDLLETLRSLGYVGH